MLVSLSLSLSLSLSPSHLRELLAAQNGMMGPPVAAALAEAGMSLLLTDLDPDSPLRDAAQRQRDEEFGADAAHQQSLFALPDTADVTITINAIID